MLPSQVTSSQFRFDLHQASEHCRASCGKAKIKKGPKVKRRDGNHEVTNYLNARFCTDAAGGDLCRIIIYNDDTFSHWLFFAGFVLINAAVMLLQVAFPYLQKARRKDAALLVVNGLFIGLGIFANLAFEQIGLDLYVVALLAALAFLLLWRRGTQPLFIYYATAYGFGLVTTFLYKTLA